MKLALGMVAVAVSLLACQRDKTEIVGGKEVPVVAGRGEVGGERGDCRPDKTCDANLLCLSGVCVRPPAADCQPIAEDLASMQLGNYAEPEDRAPVVDKEEGQCLDKAHDKWAAAQCAPRMFPELAASKDSGECGAISQKVAAAMSKQVDYSSNPQMKSWFDITIKIMKESCEQDHWPDTLKRCALAADISQNPMGMQGCEKEMPPAFQQRMQERMQKAMQTWQQQQAGGG
jgi:hypothetical protein